LENSLRAKLEAMPPPAIIPVTKFHNLGEAYLPRMTSPWYATTAAGANQNRQIVAADRKTFRIVVLGSQEPGVGRWGRESMVDD
jgi:hypothetical protein